MKFLIAYVIMALSLVAAITLLAYTEHWLFASLLTLALFGLGYKESKD